MKIFLSAFLLMMLLCVEARAVSEEDIPVRLEVAKKASADESPWLRLMLGLGVVAVLAAGALVYIRKVKAKMPASKNSMQIQMLTQHHLGPRKSLAIIRVAGESILIGVTDQNISLIKSLSLLDEDIPNEVPSQFANVLKNPPDASPEEDFTLSDIKDVVSRRLKNLRTFQ